MSCFPFKWVTLPSFAWTSITFSSDENNVYFAKVNAVQIPSKNEISQNINLISELKNAFGSEIIKTKNISFNDELINGLLSQYK